MKLDLINMGWCMCMYTVLEHRPRPQDSQLHSTAMPTEGLGTRLLHCKSGNAKASSMGEHNLGTISIRVLAKVIKEGVAPSLPSFTCFPPSYVIAHSACNLDCVHACMLVHMHIHTHTHGVWCRAGDQSQAVEQVAHWLLYY